MRRGLALLPASLPLLLALELAAARGGIARWPEDPAPAPAQVYHVRVTGADGNSGSESSPFRSVQRAVSVAEPGDTIEVYAGTYEGVVEIRRSGREDAPIVLKGAGNGEVVLTAPFRPVDCSETAPTTKRTIQILGGADYWTIRDLTVEKGILIMAPGKQDLRPPDFTSRTLPGRGPKPDRQAGERLLPNLGVDPSDGIRLINLDIRGRGLLTMAARHGELADSRIHDIDCGTGAAVWLNRFSDFWHVHDNDVRDVAASKEHYMSEGIRLGSGSSYGVVERNVVEHLQGKGRGITADVGASWNVYRDNRVDDTDINFSEQASGWGNQYLHNISQNARRVGYQVYGVGGMDEAQKLQKRQERGQGLGRTEPPEEGHSTPHYLRFECNESKNDHVAFSAGDVVESTFLHNDWASVRLSRKLQATWTAKGNLWDGVSATPSQQPSTASFASCRAG